MITNSFAKVQQVSQLSKHFTKKCNSIFTLRELMFAAHKYMFVHRELIFISCEQNFSFWGTIRANRQTIRPKSYILMSSSLYLTDLNSITKVAKFAALSR